MTINISTPDVVAARFAGALYGLELNYSTMNVVLSIGTSSTAMNALLDNLYTTDFGSQTTAAVATIVATNVGLATDVPAYNAILAALNGASAGHQGSALSALLASFAQMTSDPTYGTAATAWENKVYNADAYAHVSTNTSFQTISSVSTTIPVATQTLTLSTGADTKVGGAGNDTFDGSVSATFSAFDNLDGGAGTDTLNALIATTTLPAGVTVKNIEIANVNTSGAGLTADFSGWTGLTSLSTASGAAGLEAITAAATTAVTVGFVDNGTVNTVDGGSSLTLTETGVLTGGSLTVGGTTAVAGNITISETVTAANTAGTTAATTKGGTTVSITETGTGTHGVMNVTDGAAAATVAGTLSTVTLDGYKGNSTITSNVLTSLTLANHANNADSVTITNSLTTPTASTLALTLNGTLGTTLVASSGKVTEIDVTTATAASTLAAITDNVNLTTLKVAGTKVLTLTSNVGIGALTSLTVSGTAGLTDATILPATVTTVDTSGTTGVVTLGATTVTAGISTSTAFTGGAGNDIISVGATTKAITLGAGDNTVSMLSGTTALGTGGTITAGGAGIDTLSMVAADAATASATATFGTKVTGFDRLNVVTQTAVVIDAAALGNFNYVTTTGAANTLTVNNMVTSGTGATVVIKGADTGLTLGGTAGAGTSDVLNLTLSDGTGGAVAFGTITAPNIETVKISMVDSQTTPVGYTETATLVDTAASVITVSGNSGLNLTFAGTALTSLDASGITLAGGFTYTSGALQYASTVKGSLLGGDTISLASALANTTITETAGSNTITGASGTYVDTITVAGTGTNTIVTGTGNDVITVGNGTNTITGNAGADAINLAASHTNASNIVYLAAAANASATGANMDTITNFTTTVDKIQFSAGATPIGALAVVSGTSSFAAMGSVVTDATSVATVANVYTQLTADLNNIANAFAASVTTAAGVVAREVTFTSGAAAGTYLVINDGVAAFQGANDVVIKLVGTTTVVAADLAIIA